MNYNECKQVLYNSDAIEKIPDSWKEEVPIIFDEHGKKKIGFLFSIVKNGKTKLKKMIAVSIENGEIREYTIEELQDLFQVSNQYLRAININNYDVYFLQKQEYEIIFSKIVEGNSYIDMNYFLELTKVLFSLEQYEHIISRIGKDFYKS